MAPARAHASVPAKQMRLKRKLPRGSSGRRKGWRFGRQFVKQRSIAQIGAACVAACAREENSSSLAGALLVDRSPALLGGACGEPLFEMERGAIEHEVGPAHHASVSFGP